MYVFVCVCMSVYILVCACESVQIRKIVSCLTWMLGTELASSAKAVYAFNC